MKKVLILSCGTGGGHNSAAKAICNNLTNKGIYAEFYEYLEIINTNLSYAINELYLKSTKGNGHIFKNIYRLGELYEKTKITSPVYAFNKLSKTKLYKYILENGFDYIITTHLFAAQALTEIKKEHDIHFIEIATDYRAIPFWQETNPDYIIVPHKDLINEFSEKGINVEKIKAFGIPVSNKFSENIDKEECYRDLNLDSNNKYILMMTGSMGFGNIIEIIKKITDKFLETIIVACGNNDELYNKLKNNFDYKKVIPIKFTDKINEYMKISELIITKPGGLSSTEAATVNIPIIHAYPIPGCENYNAKFFQDKGMSISCNNDEEILSAIHKLLTEKEFADNMIKNQEKNINKHACDDICNFVIDKLK